MVPTYWDMEGSQTGAVVTTDQSPGGGITAAADKVKVLAIDTATS